MDKGKRNSENRKTPAEGFYNRVVKRLLDIVISVVGLIVLSPLLLIAAILVRATPISCAATCSRRRSVRTWGWTASTPPCLQRLSRTRI